MTTTGRKPDVSDPSALQEYLDTMPRRAKVALNNHHDCARLFKRVDLFYIKVPTTTAALIAAVLSTYVALSTDAAGWLKVSAAIAVGVSALGSLVDGVVGAEARAISHHSAGVAFADVRRDVEVLAARLKEGLIEANELIVRIETANSRYTQAGSVGPVVPRVIFMRNQRERARDEALTERPQAS